MNDDDSRRTARRRRAHRLAAAALLAIYAAVMHGHLSSMDGFLMQRQARALAIEHSVRFGTPAWFWNGEAAWNSKFGIGLSLLYVPGMLVASPLATMVPTSAERPPKPSAFYLEQLYDDPLYAVGGSWVHAVVTAAAAYLVARMVTVLGGSVGASLWGLALYGLGSLALVYSRGDFAQPLVGLCWIAALLAGVRLRLGEAHATSITAAALATGYAILTRPFEGALLVPVVLLLVAPRRRATWNARGLAPALAVVASAAVAFAITGLVNEARLGDPTAFGYRLDGVWTMPDANRLAHLVVGPARGLVWALPAVLLVPSGAATLWRRGRRTELTALLVLAAAMFVVTAVWRTWWGGWCWGPRLMLPAFPLLAAIAAAGIDDLSPRSRRWLPALLLAIGLACALPGTVTDLLGGHVQRSDANPTAWTWMAWPPYGAWSYLQRVFPVVGHDVGAVDVLWFRLAPATGYLSLAVPAVLLAVAAALAVRCRRECIDADEPD